MKKILFIVSKTHSNDCGHRIHYDWVEDCEDIYDIKLWHSHLDNTSLSGLQKCIDTFKPDYIYATHRKTLSLWLPDLTNIKVPKIFVEVDTYKYDRYDPWYDQFDMLLCREPFWETKYSPHYGVDFFFDHLKECRSIKPNKNPQRDLVSASKRLYIKHCRRLQKAKTWKTIPFFCWSIPEKSIVIDKQSNRSSIRFIGKTTYRLYPVRKYIKKILGDRVIFEVRYSDYNELLKESAALICPTESIYGDYIPAKLFEFLASGSAVLTNCDLQKHGLSDLEDYVIKYNDIKDLESKLSMDFTPYQDKAVEIMQNYTHREIYSRIFI